MLMHACYFFLAKATVPSECTLVPFAMLGSSGFLPHTSAKTCLHCQRRPHPPLIYWACPISHVRRPLTCPRHSLWNEGGEAGPDHRHTAPAPHSAAPGHTAEKQSPARLQRSHLRTKTGPPDEERHGRGPVPARSHFPSPLLTGVGSMRPKPAEGSETQALLLAEALGPKAAVRN